MEITTNFDPQTITANVAATWQPLSQQAGFVAVDSNNPTLEQLLSVFAGDRALFWRQLARLAREKAARNGAA